MSIKNTKNTKSMGKKLKRKHRARKTTEHIKKLGVETGIHRMVLGRSNKNIHAQILSPVGGSVIVSASSLESLIKEAKPVEGENKKGKIGLSEKVGNLIAERAKAAGIDRVACDRSGFNYHGRIAALVDAARANGLIV